MLRLLALSFGLAGLAVLLADLAGSMLREGAPRLEPLGVWWAWLHRESLLLLQPAIERHLTPLIWDPGVQTLLEWPAALDLLGLAALFGLGALMWRRVRTRRTAGTRR